MELLIFFFLGMLTQIIISETMAANGLIKITPTQQFMAGLFQLFLGLIIFLIAKSPPAMILGMGVQASLAGILGLLGIIELNPILIGRKKSPRSRFTLPKITITIEERVAQPETTIVQNPERVCPNRGCINYNKPVPEGSLFCIECGRAIPNTGKTTILH